MPYTFPTAVAGVVATADEYNQVKTVVGLNTTSDGKIDASRLEGSIPGGVGTATATATILGSTYAPRLSPAAFLAKGDGQVVDDGVVSGTSLTSASANFTNADTGKIALIYEAGAGGGPWVGTLTYVSPTQVTLSSSAPTAIGVGAVLMWGTDDTVALQAAITAGGASGATLELAALQYMFTALTLPNSNADGSEHPVTIIGQGAQWTYGDYRPKRAYGTRLVSCKVDGTPAISVNATAHISTGRNAYVFRNLTLIGPDHKQNQVGVSGSGIKVYGSQAVPFVLMDNVEIVCFGGNGAAGLWLEFVENSHFIGVRCTANYTGFKLTGNANANEFINCQAQLCLKRGLDGSDCTSLVWDGGMFQSNYGTGAYLNGVQGMGFIGTHFENNNQNDSPTEHALFIEGTSGRTNEYISFVTSRFSHMPTRVTGGGDDIFITGVSDGQSVNVRFESGFYQYNTAHTAATAALAPGDASAAQWPKIIINNQYVQTVSISDAVPASVVLDNGTNTRVRDRNTDSGLYPAVVVATQGTGGVDEAMATAYEAFKFIPAATVDHTVNSTGIISLWVKTPSATSNAALFIALYSDDGGSPSKPLAKLAGNHTQIGAAGLSTSAFTQVSLEWTGLSADLTQGQAYWVVISGNTLILDSMSSGANVVATAPASGSVPGSWTVVNGKSIKYALSLNAGTTQNISAPAGPGITAFSTAFVGTNSSSTFAEGVIATSRHFLGLLATSVTYFGAQISSTWDRALYAFSQQGIGVHASQNGTLAATTANPVLRVDRTGDGMTGGYTGSLIFGNDAPSAGTSTGALLRLQAGGVDKVILDQGGVLTTGVVPVAQIPGSYSGSRYASGQEPFPRTSCSSTQTLTAATPNSRMYGTCFTADANQTVNTITLHCVAAPSGLTLLRYGLYLDDGANNLTLLASTLSQHGTTFTTNAPMDFTFDASAPGGGTNVALVRGSRYVVATIAVGTTGPTYGGMGLGGGGLFARAPKINTSQNTITDLQTSVTSGAQITATQVVYYAVH